MQAIFRMGIPVSGKNLFPSNIQGLPTWYEIRVNKTGYTARALDYDLMVAMNAQTYAQDIADVRHGGYVLYDSSWPLDAELLREDVTFLGVPLAKMCLENFKAPRERILMKNIAYAGRRRRAARHRRRARRRPARRDLRAQRALRDSNQKALRLGYDYAMENFECPLPFQRRAAWTRTSDSILIDGNTADGARAASTPARRSPAGTRSRRRPAVMDNFIAALRARTGARSVDATTRTRPTTTRTTT